MAVRSRLGECPYSRLGRSASESHNREAEMAHYRKHKTVRATLPILHPDAAGIDIGATEIFVAVPADRDSEPVRAFHTFTQDLMSVADWLQRCGIRTVAMESTGVYWIPLMQLLESRGLEVYLVNARYAKNVPGRKTDVADCQWLQYLHSVGLLKTSFRPGSGCMSGLQSVSQNRGAEKPNISLAI